MSDQPKRARPDNDPAAAAPAVSDGVTRSPPICGEADLAVLERWADRGRCCGLGEVGGQALVNSCLPAPMGSTVTQLVIGALSARGEFRVGPPIRIAGRRHRL
jgi:hypothetical protein